MLKHFVAALTMSTALVVGILPVYAQPNPTETPSDPTILLSLNRAQNLARQAAESATAV